MKFNIYHTGSLSDKKFLITGGAGFIGSNLVEYLVQHKALKVRILDNLSLGSKDNIREFLSLPNVEFLEGDIRDFETCKTAVNDVDFVLHQAALGSVPRSIDDPLTTNEVNVNGFLNMLEASRLTGIKRFVYAASSSTYGDSPILPKQEDLIGKPLSPYAVTKYVNELYAQVYSSIYGFHSVGLRYFNVFGPKQNVNGAYAAVIPLFVAAMLKGEHPIINGNGINSRDFTFVSNVVQANIKSVFADTIKQHTVLNIAFGGQTSLTSLVDAINKRLNTEINPTFRDPRKGDVQHSFADVSRASEVIGYQPEVSFEEGIAKTVDFFQQKIQ